MRTCYLLVHTEKSIQAKIKQTLSFSEILVGSRRDIKISFYQYRNFHYKDKTVWRPSYLYNGYPILGKTVFILRQGPGCSCYLWYKLRSAYITFITCWCKISLSQLSSNQNLYYLTTAPDTKDHPHPRYPRWQQKHIDAISIEDYQRFTLGSVTLCLKAKCIVIKIG